MTVDIILSFFMEISRAQFKSTRPIINDTNFNKKNFLLIKLIISDISNIKA